MSAERSDAFARTGDVVRIPDRDALADILTSLVAGGFRHRGGWGIECRSDRDASGGTLAAGDGRLVEWIELFSKDGTFDEGFLRLDRTAPPSSLEWNLLAAANDRH